jgi:hypothetical protein
MDRRESTSEEPMIVQWCVKGLSLPDDATAHSIIDQRGGLQCNWWRDVHQISPPQMRDRLTIGNLDRHVNHFSDIDPSSGRPFSEQTPFISLSAGVVERDAAAKTNYVHRARKVGFWFGSNFGASPTAYIYVCWVVLAPRSAVEVEAVAEEVRDLNTYRRYSDFQTEGEIAVKIIVPDNQIQQCERWDLNADTLSQTWVYKNPRFTLPELLTNIRELL